MAPPPSSKKTQRSSLTTYFIKNILPRLPFKYLNILKCISKELHSLISTDAKFSADQSRSEHTSSSGFVYMTSSVLPFFQDPALIGVPDPSLNFLNPTSFYNQIVSCTNGLLLLDGEFSHKTSLCLCNPATKEMVFVPKSDDSSEIYFIYKMGLAYDPCELPDRFTIVHPLLYHPREDTLYQYQFNVFRSDNGKWTRSSQSVSTSSYSEASKAVCAKGVIYWCCGKYFLWYDTKKDLAGTIMLPVIKERIHVGIYAGEITFSRAWVGGIDVWILTGGFRWDRLYATSWVAWLDALNFCYGMQLRCNSGNTSYPQYSVGFYGQFVYIVVQMKYQGDTVRLFRWEIAIGRVKEKGQITVWEPCTHQ